MFDRKTRFLPYFCPKQSFSRILWVLPHVLGDSTTKVYHPGGRPFVVESAYVGQDTVKTR